MNPTNIDYTGKALEVPSSFSIPTTKVKTPSVVTSAQGENIANKIKTTINQPSGTYKQTENTLPVYGESSQAVLNLQKSLNSKNASVPGYTPIAEDGKYGQQTLNAVNFVPPINNKNTTDTTTKNESGTGNTMLDDYIKSKKKLVDNQNTAYTEFQNTINNVMSGNGLTSSQKEMLSNLNKEFENAKSAQTVANKSEENIYNMANIRGGTQRYSPEVAASRVQVAVSSGIQRITNIATTQATTLAKMRLEFEQGNIKNARDLYDAYMGNQDKQDKAITDVYTTITNYNKEVADSKFKQLQEDNKLAQNTIENTLKQQQLDETKRSNKANESIKREELKNKTLEASSDPFADYQWASEYAATGKMPSGIPAKSKKNVAVLASTMPQPVGRVVSAITGMPDPTLNAKLEEGLVAGQDAIKRLDQLKTIFGEFHTGLLGGTIGNISPGVDRQTYMDMRGEIIQLIRQARSGQAFTASEAAEYEKKLPGNWNQTLGLGKDGSLMIENLKNSMEVNLQTKLAQHGLMITSEESEKTKNKTEQTTEQPTQESIGQQSQVEYEGKIYNVDANGEMTEA